jgi:hypothetical protein
MSPFLIAIAAAAVAAPAGAGTEIVLAGREIRVRDAFDLSHLATPERRRVADRVIARLPAGRTRITLARSTIAALARRAGLVTGPTGEVAGSIRFTMNPAPLNADRACLRLRSAVPAGGVVARANSDETACDPTRQPAPVRYDREAGVVRAAGLLPEAAFLGPLLLPEAPRVERGDDLAGTIFDVPAPAAATQAPEE